MQLKSREGIACDYCGTTYKTDFTYYSFDFRQLEGTQGQKPALQMIFRENIVFSLDICQRCFAKFKDKVMKNYKPLNHGQGVCCDFTGNILKGNFIYYHCDVTKVNVRLSEQPYVCVKCQRQYRDIAEKCDNCEATEFVRIADMKTDERFVELDLCEEAYQSLVNKAVDIRKMASEWSTTS